MSDQQAYMRRGEVREVLGIGRHKMRTFIECGILTPVHFRIDETGKPLDKAVFRRQQVEEIAGNE